MENNKEEEQTKPVEQTTTSIEQPEELKQDKQS